MNRLTEIETQIKALQQERDNLLNSVPELQWITALEAAQMPDIVGRLVFVELIVKHAQTGDALPLCVAEDSGVNGTWLQEHKKLAVLK